MPDAASVSTYCFVANWKLVSGSCVTVTEVNPTGANDVAPNAMLVVPSVIWLLVSAPLGMLVNVFAEPDMDLLVNVCAPVNVATEESILIVLAAEPSKVVPVFSCKPVPTVKAAVVLAVIVPEAPKATVTPL